MWHWKIGKIGLEKNRRDDNASKEEWVCVASGRHIDGVAEKAIPHA